MLRAIIKSRKIYECNICQIRLEKLFSTVVILGNLLMKIKRFYNKEFKDVFRAKNNIIQKTIKEKDRPKLILLHHFQSRLSCKPVTHGAIA